eukprot:7378489-Prymnesium_polylepis.2
MDTVLLRANAPPDCSLLMSALLPPVCRMPPKAREAYDDGVAAVLGGMPVGQAWEECGKPGESRDSGMRNIRKRVATVKAAREKAATEAAEEAAKAAAPTPAPKATFGPKRKNGETAPFRLNSKQVDKAFAAEQAKKRSFIDALKASSLELHEDLRASKTRTAPSIAKRYNADLPAGVKQLESWRIRQHVEQGWAGMSPPPKGPPPIVPKDAVAIVATHASMSQLNGNEVKPREIKRETLALVAGTELEQYLRSKQQRA